jgi:hypothetical protein
MEDTSDAATMTCHSKDNVTSQPDACTTGQYGEPGFAVAYERATAGATRETFYNRVVSQQVTWGEKTWIKKKKQPSQ